MKPKCIQWTCDVLLACTVMALVVASCSPEGKTALKAAKQHAIEAAKECHADPKCKQAVKDAVDKVIDEVQ